MNERDNPYTPNAGATPQAIAGRDDQLDSFDALLARLERGRSAQSMIVTGLRGVGKTVLLGQFRDKAHEKHWVVVEMEINKHGGEDFRVQLATRLRVALLRLSPKARWTDRIRHAASVLKSFTLDIDANGSLSTGLDVEAAEGFADNGNLAMDLTDVLVSIGEAAADHKTGIVLLVDEIQFLHKEELEAVIEALHKTVQYSLPVTLVGAGLPQIAELAGDAKSYAERLFTFPHIENLGREDAEFAISQPASEENVDYDESALKFAVEVTEGYPYFLQELGYAAWNVAEGPTIHKEDVEEALPVYKSKLDGSFFRVRLDRTTTLQRAYLRAMAELGPKPQKAEDVARIMGRTSSNLGPVRAGLVNMGLLYTPEHGYAAFTVPQFDEFMRRAIPKLSVPEPSRKTKRRRGQAE